MRRRAFLATGLAAMTATAGCLDDESADDGTAGTADGSPAAGDDSAPSDDDGADELRTVDSLGVTPDPSISETGLAPETESVDTPSVDLADLDTYEADGVAVPLVSIDEAYDWYRAGEARFVDARNEQHYEDGHVAGAILSPINGGFGDDDPTREWDEAERVVTYCTCPHALAGQRASELVQSGHEAVFAIDEGFGPWIERSYPIESGDGVQQLSAKMTVSGRVDAVHAGESVVIVHEDSEQYYAGQIADDGSYELAFQLYGVEPGDTLAVETPAGTRRGTVAELTDEQWL